MHGAVCRRRFQKRYGRMGGSFRGGTKPAVPIPRAEERLDRTWQTDAGRGLSCLEYLGALNSPNKKIR